jgi:hypothetical protein
LVSTCFFQKKTRRFKLYGLKPTEKAGEGSIPSRYSGYKLQPAVSLSSVTEMSGGIKYNMEATMKTGNINQTKKTTVDMNVGLKLKFGLIVALVAGCLLATPSA